MDLDLKVFGLQIRIKCHILLDLDWKPFGQWFMIILIIYFTGVGLENTWTTNLDVFFCQNDLHVLLTKQFYKINCEIIKIKLIEKKHICI